MLLTRSLPTQFLLPTWGMRNFLYALQRAHKSDSTRSKPKPSLFDELFPEERKDANAAGSKTMDKLPAFEWNNGPDTDWGAIGERNRTKRKDLSSAVPKSSKPVPLEDMKRPPQRIREEQRLRRESSVLVLNCASKTLEESDFFRLGPKGEHIEGWTSGILKVIQGRDTNTLERLGHYFILFSTDAAARAYLDQTIRLHTLSRTHTASNIGASPLPLPPRFLREGEDLNTVLRGFSLVPGHSKLSLRLITRPHKPAMSRILNDGGPAALATMKTKAEDMVLFSVDMGQISYHDLRSSLNDDGKGRNLQWKLADGKDNILRINNDPPDAGDDAFSGEKVDEESRHKNPFPRKPTFRRPAKYIISFKDGHEARRFVREWHRRPFPLQREHNTGDEPPPIVNAEILW